MQRAGGLMTLLVLAAGGAGCSGVAASPAGWTRAGRAAWTVAVPPGWHAVRFSESDGGIRAAGIQVSSVRLPAPALAPRSPVQVSGEVLPTTGIGLIISTDTDPGLEHGQIATPPLPLPWPDGSGHDWQVGSSLAGDPVFETLWFRARGTVYIASIKIGSTASRGAQKTVGAIVRSFQASPG